jgi:hypothetical protein
VLVDDRCETKEQVESHDKAAPGDKVDQDLFLRHSRTFPRHARLLACFLRSVWRPAPERTIAATATMLRALTFFPFLCFAIMDLESGK